MAPLLRKTKLASPNTSAGQPRQRRGTYTGAALADARRAKERTYPNPCEEVGANWWWWHWKWVGGSAKKHLPSSGCSHKHAVAQHRHTSGGQLKHTSPDGLLYWHTQHKLHLQTALPSSTLLHKPIWMGTPPSSATCSTWLRHPRPIPASPLTWWIFGLSTFTHLETG
jgi:hypothetical protein